MCGLIFILHYQGLYFTFNVIKLFVMVHLLYVIYKYIKKLNIKLFPIIYTFYHFSFH